MKAALLIVLSLSAMAFAGPAFNKNNQINLSQQQQQQQQQFTSQQQQGDAKSAAIDTLKQWCFSSQMSQQELTASFKKLIGIVKSNAADQTTESAVMGERICQGAIVQKSQQSGETFSQTGADAQAHELIKDVYMDALISCKTRECSQQLLKIINSQQVDSIRASYYMTRIAVTEKDSIKDDEEIKQLAESMMQTATSGRQGEQTESVERQKLFATTALIGKFCQNKPQEADKIKQVADQVAKTIVERYIKPVSDRDVEQYKQEQQQGQQVNEQLAKKIAKRNAALRALANIPGHVLKQSQGVDDVCAQLASDKDELSTVRQSAIECLAMNDKQMQTLKQIAFDQDEPIEVRVAAYRSLMTAAYADDKKDEQTKQQIAQEIVDQVVKHCADERNQQNDDQFVLYAISHLDNVRTSQQPEHAAIKECITKNKQHYMQIQVLCKKFKQQLADVRASSRNYKLEQEFNQLESGLVLEGDIVYESQKKQQSGKSMNKPIANLPKLLRVNVSMPVMGETVNVLEVTVRQTGMDKELSQALNLIQNTKITGAGAMSKVVDSFKQSVEQQQQQQQQQQQYRSNRDSQDEQDDAQEADLTIKVDGRTVVYLCADDFKTSAAYNKQQQQHGDYAKQQQQQHGDYKKDQYSQQQQQKEQQHIRNTRSIYGSNSIVDDVIEYLKREPINFNRGFNFNLNERFAKVLDVDANIIAGLRFESRAQGRSGDDFELVAKIEPRLALEAIVGPSQTGKQMLANTKNANKKLMQRVSTKTAMNLRLRFKQNELLDAELELPMNTMDLFTFESQLVEESRQMSGSYKYLSGSIYDQGEDIYAAANQKQAMKYNHWDNTFNKRSSVFDKTDKWAINKLFARKTIGAQLETSERVARQFGMRAKLAYIVSPKDMSVLVQAVAQKYEPTMRGYRVQVQQTERARDGQQYAVTVSTPGSRIERTIQARLATQFNKQRSYVKLDMQASQMGQASLMTELVHDSQRLYAIKSELVSKCAQTGQQQRHSLDAGLARQQQTSSGRLAAASFKPYLTIDSTELKRPLQLQGIVSYQQAPKTVISYELKCPTSGDYVQGKLIMDSRKGQSSAVVSRRSMKSPIELALNSDATLTHELIAKLDKHAVKAHQMIDWDCDKYTLQADSTIQHKNVQKQHESQLVAQIKLTPEQQTITVERKCPQQLAQQLTQFRFQLASQCQGANKHELSLDCSYSPAGSRQHEQATYKHKLEFFGTTAIGNNKNNKNKQFNNNNKIDVAAQVELASTEFGINEKLAGRVRIVNERSLKLVSADLAGRQKQVKLGVEFESLAKHQINMHVQTPRSQHKMDVRANQRQFAVSARSEKNGQLVGKLAMDVQKQQPIECKIVLEVPQKRVHAAADLKLQSGKQSSLALQTGRVAAKAEFSLDTVASIRVPKFVKQMIGQESASKMLARNLRLKANIKDLATKEAYWMDTAVNAGDWDKQSSFVRMDTPIYNAELEFEPRDLSTKFGAFARSKRSTNQFDSIYSTRDSLISALALDANKLARDNNKLWVLRSIISSNAQNSNDSLKQKAVRALFEFADRAQAHKHSLNWSPEDDKLAFDFEHQQPAGSSRRSLRGLIAGRSSNQQSKASYEDDSMNVNVDAFLPFNLAENNQKYNTYNQQQQDIDEAWAKVTAVSRRERRSTDSQSFKKHESELRYKKDAGVKAWMKHVDADDKRHEIRMESDAQPSKWAKISYDSDKHGKGAYEHKWRKHVTKRSHDNEDVYANKMSWRHESPMGANKWQHEHEFEWNEPIGMTKQQQQAWLSRNSGRFSSQVRKPRSIGSQDFDQYSVKFDFEPEFSQGNLHVEMPGDIMHQSQFECKPNERLYKLQSKLFDSRTAFQQQQPSYSLFATTKGLATADQEPMFVDYEHPALEQGSWRQQGFAKKGLSRMFAYPMKLDYSDKFGRAASFDYDHSPESIAAGKQIAAGLRQKRAAVYYKDDSADFEHSSNVDFYPETLFARTKRTGAFNTANANTAAIKAQTKYGPVTVRADSTNSVTFVELESPVCNAKITREQPTRGAQLIKVRVDNKSQQVELAKLVREWPLVRKMAVAKRAARAFDESRFEHETELLVSIVDKIIKLKSRTQNKGRQTMTAEAEWNEQQDKMVAKINGERVDGQLVVDMARKQAEIALQVDAGRTFKHVTRVEPTSDNCYMIDSITTHQSKPVFKITGKLAEELVSEPSHAFSFSRRAANQWTGGKQHGQQHVSTFEAVIYEPKQVIVSGEYDCEKKEGRLVYKDAEDNKLQETFVKYDESTDSVLVQTRLTKPTGPVYTTKAKLSLAAIFNGDKCLKYADAHTCKSEAVVSNQSGSYGAQIVPDQFVAIMTPSGKQTFSWPY